MDWSAFFDRCDELSSLAKRYDRLVADEENNPSDVSRPSPLSMAADEICSEVDQLVASGQRHLETALAFKEKARNETVWVE